MIEGVEEEIVALRVRPLHLICRVVESELNEIKQLLLREEGVKKLLDEVMHGRNFPINRN